LNECALVRINNFREAKPEEVAEPNASAESLQ
jgi:hypothetical protein